MSDRRKLKFKDGRPVGWDRVDNIAALNVHARNCRSFSSIYSYGVLRKVFSWAKHFRAGFVIIAAEDDRREMLLVRSHPNSNCSSTDRNGAPVHHGMYGPPKGQRERVDRSALDTALRETREETDIDIIAEAAAGRAKITQTVFVARRPEVGIEEIMIWFIAVFDRRPAVRIDSAELQDYMWVEMNRNLRMIGPVSTPTKKLLLGLENLRV